MNPKKSGTFLDKIVAKKKRRVEDQKKRRSLNKISAEAETISSVKDFRSAIKRKKRISLIAEIKKNSPLKSRLYQNKGLLNKGFKPSDLARCYDQAGADAISVITEEDFFYGSPDYLKAVRLSTTLPVLRKDFIFDPYQIYESRA
ncbi:MAG: indole-3-glycerol-phosphate synthase, partial [Planctomycetes bacterium]|nr:indole-3-glycerol-phosphate synthase [Planctomycetota bacterium]